MSSLTDPELITGETCIGDAGNDSFKLQVTGKGVAELETVAVEFNTLIGGDGNNKGDLSAKHSGNADVQYNSLTGGVDADKIKLSVTSKNGRALAYANQVNLGEGKDSLQVTTKSGDGVASVFDNFVNMGNGGSSIKLSAQNKGMTYDSGMRYSNDADVSDNLILAGDGPNKVDVSAKSGAGWASIGYYDARNVIATGDDKDTLKFTVTNKGEITSRYDYYDSDTSQYLREDFVTGARVGFNSIVSGGGDDQIMMKVKSGVGPALIGYNTISGSTGENKISLTTQNKGDLGVEEYSDYDAGTNSYQVYDGIFTIDSLIEGNSISSSTEDDSIMLSAKSKKGVAAIGATTDGYFYYDGGEGNTIAAGDGDNTIKLSAQTTGTTAMIDYGYGLETVYFGNAQVTRNAVYTGDGEDEFSLSANGGKVTAYVNANSLFSGDNKDEISFSLKGYDTYADFNHINGGSEDDEISLSLKAKSYAASSGNTMMGGNGNDTIDIELSGKSGSAFGGYVDDGNSIEDAGNSILGGEGEDNIEISLKATDKSSGNLFAFNSISGGDDNDTVKIKTSAKAVYYYGFNAYGNILSGDGGEDRFELDLKGGLDDGEIQQFFENNTIDGGAGDNDTILIGTKNQEIDLTSVDEGNLMNLEKIDLGKSKSNLILDDASVQAMTDGDDLLLIGGKGSVEFGYAASYVNAVNGYTYFDLGGSIIGLGDKIDFVDPASI